MKKQLLLFITEILLPLTTYAYTGDVVIDGIRYNVVTKGQTAEVSFNNYSGNVTIPSTIEYDGVTCYVTSIGEQAFWKCEELTSITIPNTVTSIGQYAFTGCRSLTSVVIPSSVEKICFDAFWCCSGLTTVTISDGVISIDDNAFSSCNSLSSITIPKSVTFIGKSVFGGCRSLVSINVDEDNKVYDSRDNCNAIIETATNTLVAGCMNTTIPQDVSIIGSFAFFGHEGLTNIIIPNSVISINDYAFDTCVSLTTITIPNSVKIIDEYAFANCTNIKNITIGSGIEMIKEFAFGCPDLTDLYCFAENVPIAYSKAFYASYIEYATLHVPNTSVDAYKTVAPWMNFKEIVSLTDQETSINVVVDRKDVVSFHSLDGKLLSKPQKGLNIIRMSNGESKKVMIK